MITYIIPKHTLKIAIEAGYIKWDEELQEYISTDKNPFMAYWKLSLSCPIS